MEKIGKSFGTVNARFSLGGYPISEVIQTACSSGVKIFGLLTAVALFITPIGAQAQDPTPVPVPAPASAPASPSSTPSASPSTSPPGAASARSSSTADTSGELSKQAAASFEKGDVNHARDAMNRAINAACDAPLQKAIRQAELGHLLYMTGDYASSALQYEDSIAVLSKLAPQSDFLIAALEELSGGYSYLKQGDKNAATLEHIAAIMLARSAADGGVARSTGPLEYGWALLSLSDAYNRIGRQAEAKAVFEKAIYLFRKSNADRLLAEFCPGGKSSNSQADYAEARRIINHYVFGKAEQEPVSEVERRLASICTGSKNVDECDRDIGSPWNLKPSMHKDAPGYVWLNPHVPQRALVICVHGLGLHHKAYESFARRISNEGFTVVAFDVRGFGSYLETRGQEKLNLAECVADLRTVISHIRQDNPDMPLFLLGESMGGAIALNVAAQSPQLMDGLVLSVPAGSMYKATTTALRVAVNLLTGPNKPLNVNQAVVNRATKDRTLRESWSNDADARLMLSPRELFQFKKFMSQNEEVARRLPKDLPVIMFQGADDKLIRPEGSYSLFSALPTNDKALVLLGNTEHLIFEAGQFKDDVTMGVLGWMSAHSRTHAHTSRTAEQSNR